MNVTAQRFVDTLGMFYAHVSARIPDSRTSAPAGKPSAANSKHANSKKAIDTRKAKYGGSKMRRETRDEKRSKGHNIRGEAK